LVVNQLIEDGIVSDVRNNSESKNITTSKEAIWDIRMIADQMRM
jgi:hypothetical protein